MRGIARIAFGVTLALSAAAVAAAEIPIRHRVVTIDVAGTVVPVPLAGRITTTGNGAALDARIFLAADLGAAQRQIEPILRARLNRDDRCGERIEVKRATVAAMAPAARVTVALSYGRSVCVTRDGKRYRTKLFEESGQMVFDITPGARDGVIVATVSVISIKAGALLSALLRDPKLLQPLVDRIANEAVIRIEALVPAAVWRIGPAFQRVAVTARDDGALGLEIVAGKRMTPAALDALVAALNGPS